MIDLKETKQTGQCQRKEDLVAYLYDELTETEKSNFARHLTECDECHAELGAFQRVRDDLSAWQIGFAPATGVELPRHWTAVIREFFLLFPAWARGVALAGAAACLMLLTLSVAAPGWGGKLAALSPGAAARLNQDEVQAMVREAVAREKLQIEANYQTQLASFKEEVRSEQQVRIEAIEAQYEAQIKAMQAAWKADIRRNNRQMNSIRSYFALDDGLDSWGRGGQER